MQTQTGQIQGDFPLVQVTNYGWGFRNVKKAAESGLFNLETPNGDTIENSLCFNMFPRYLHADGDKSRINPGTSLGDVFAAIMYLYEKVHKLEKAIDEHKKVCSENRIIIDQVSHMTEHVHALENNLRSLASTLVYHGDVTNSASW